MQNVNLHFLRLSSWQWLSIALCVLLVWSDIARALPAKNQHPTVNHAEISIQDRLNHALAGYQTVYAYQDNALTFTFHEQVKKAFSPDEIQSEPKLKNLVEKTEAFQSIDHEMNQIAAFQLKKYNLNKETQDKLTAQDVAPLQMLMTSIRDDMLSNKNFTFSMSDAFSKLEGTDAKLLAQHDHLYQTFKSMYEAAIGQAMTTHADLMALDFPDEKNIDTWSEQVKKELTTTYCDDAPSFFKQPNITISKDAIQPPTKQNATCYQTASYVFDTLTYRPYFNIDETLEDLNQGIDQTNQALEQVKKNVGHGFGLQKHSKYEQAYLSMFNRPSGVLLLTDALQGAHPYQVTGLMYDAWVDGDLPAFDVAMKNLKGAASVTYQMCIGTKDAFLKATGQETTIEKMQTDQGSKVNPLFHYNHFLNPQQYNPRPYLNHNPQKMHSLEGRDRIRAAIAESIAETRSGIDELHQILFEFGKKYKGDTSVTFNLLNRNNAEAIDLTTLKGANQDLKKGIQSLIAYYPASAMVVAKTQPMMVQTIVEQMVQTTIAQRKSQKNQKTIGTVMLVVAGVLILTGVGAGIGAGLAGTAAATAGWMMVGKAVLITGFVIGTADTIYSGQQAYVLYRHYEKTKAATYIYLQETDPTNYRLLYDQYQMQLAIAILAGAFTVVDIMAIKNLANIKNWIKPESIQPVLQNSPSSATQKIMNGSTVKPSIKNSVAEKAPILHTNHPSAQTKPIKTTPVIHGKTDGLFTDDLPFFSRRISAEQHTVWRGVVEDYLSQNPRYVADVDFRHAIQKRILDTHETGHTRLDLSTGNYVPDPEKLIALAKQKAYLREIGYGLPIDQSLKRARRQTL